MSVRPNPAHRTAGVLALQRQIGNSATQRLLQRKKILNLASGTRSETLMRPAKPGDEVINVDSGHMLLADILRERSADWFESKRAELGGAFNDAAFAKKVEATAKATRQGIPEPTGLDTSEMVALLAQIQGYAHGRVLRDFVIRGLFEAKPGKAGFDAYRSQLVPAEREEFDKRAKAIVAAGKGSFEFGFVETLSQRFKQEFDEVHVISALGFDLIDDADLIKAVHGVLKPGGELVIVSEKSGMASRAVKEKKGQPVLDLNERPVLKEVKNKQPLMITSFFDYLPQASAFGEGVFEKAYPGMQTQHTAGDEQFDKTVRFFRLVFRRRG